MDKLRARNIIAKNHKAQAFILVFPGTLHQPKFFSDNNLNQSNQFSHTDH
ncbi:MAG: hypothetical protein OFPII_21150 [Osedax symbiont Rs1]|nr:MAG: hypothetical protein OFPII_21150 [Osedax symbiont Rs1]